MWLRLLVPLLFFLCACARDGRVQAGSRVRLDYVLEADGKFFESTEAGGPIEIVQGEGGMPEVVDRGLIGMRIGQRADFDLPAGAGFGRRDESKIESLPLASMGALAERIKPGKKVMGFKDGKAVSGRVLEVGGGIARVDFNHPLAGKALRYRVQVVRVSPP